MAAFETIIELNAQLAQVAEKIRELEAKLAMWKSAAEIMKDERRSLLVRAERAEAALRANIETQDALQARILELEAELALSRSTREGRDLMRATIKRCRPCQDNLHFRCKGPVGCDCYCNRDPGRHGIPRSSP
jgi:chromosome segregation ATPase